MFTPPHLRSKVRNLIDQIHFNIIKSKRNQRKVLNNFETIDYILEYKCSISRYGDGELDLVMARKYGLPSILASKHMTKIYHIGLKKYWTIDIRLIIF